MKSRERHIFFSAGACLFCLFFSFPLKAGIVPMSYVNNNKDLFEALERLPGYHRPDDFNQQNLEDYQKKWANFFPWYEKNIPSNWMLSVDGHRCEYEDNWKSRYNFLFEQIKDDLSSIAGQFRSLASDIESLSAKGIFEESERQKLIELKKQRAICLQFLRSALENSLRFSDRIFRQSLHDNNFFNSDKNLVDVLLQEPSFKQGKLGEALTQFATYVPEHDACPPIDLPNKKETQNSFAQKDLKKDSCDVLQIPDIEKAVNNQIQFHKIRLRSLKKGTSKSLRVSSTPTIFFADKEKCQMVKIVLSQNKDGEIVGIDQKKSFVQSKESDSPRPLLADEGEKLYTKALLKKTSEERLVDSGPSKKFSPASKSANGVN